jgi:hypothetical protein
VAHGTSESGKSPFLDTKVCWSNISALGLARVFVTPHPMLREVIVRGDLVINEANRDSE